jgi:cyclopropane-fatty-acyl-phospholipid synthase
VHGVTISQQQYSLARERVAREGLADLVTIELRDYRDVDGQYDAAVSIEMFEAVGEKFWPVYFDTLVRRLKPGARALIQSITIAESQFEAYRASSDFIREFIFPGGMLPSAERSSPQRAAPDSPPHRCTRSATTTRTLRTWRATFDARRSGARKDSTRPSFARGGCTSPIATVCRAAYRRDAFRRVGGPLT